MTLKSLSQKYSHKLDIFFTVPLCEEDIAMIETNCRRLGFKPAPRAVHRAVHRFGLDSISRGLVEIHHVYNTYNTSAVSVAAKQPDNPVTAIFNQLTESPAAARALNDLERMRPDLSREEIKQLAFELGVRELWFRGGDATGVGVAAESEKRA